MIVNRHSKQSVKRQFVRNRIAQLVLMLVGIWYLSPRCQVQVRALPIWGRFLSAGIQWSGSGTWLDTRGCRRGPGGPLKIRIGRGSGPYIKMRLSRKRMPSRDYCRD